RLVGTPAGGPTTPRRGLGRQYPFGTEKTGVLCTRLGRETYRLAIGDGTSARRSRAATARVTPWETGAARRFRAGLEMGQLFQVEGLSSEPRSESTIASVAVAQTTPMVSTTISGMLPMLSP